MIKMAMGIMDFVKEIQELESFIKPEKVDELAKIYLPFQALTEEDGLVKLFNYYHALMQELLGVNYD